ncbi:MAG: PqqD family peptide modification chaperone [Smithella sp.]
MLIDLYESIPRRLSDLWRISPQERALIFSDALMRIQSYLLNHVASHIWYLCDGQRTVREIANTVFRSLDVRDRPSEDLILSDIVSFVVSLGESHLIELGYPAKKIDVLLVSPPNSHYYHREINRVPENSSPPLGLCSIATILRQNGIAVHLEDFQAAEKDCDQIVPLIERYCPRIVGISATTTSYFQAKKMAGIIRKYYPEIKLVLGGIHGSSLPEDVLRNSVFDIVARGEGEYTMLELAQSMPLDEKSLAAVSGISYISASGDMCHNEARPFISDLDSLSPPDKALIDLYRYHQKGAILTGRGCPNQCIFCSCSAFCGARYRSRSTGHILREVIDTVHRYGIHEFEIHDDTFTITRDRVVSFCDAILEAGLDITWGCQSRASTIDADLAKMMYGSGCRSIQFGVESGNQRILNSIKKGITLEQVETAVSAARNAGIPQIICTFMIGHPEDTRETIHDTVDFALHLHDLGLTVSPFTVLTPLPGTEVFHRAADYGLKIIDDDWERYTFSKVNIETKYLKAEEINEIYFETLEKILSREGRLRETE